MGLQTWQYLLGISYANTNNQNNSVYSSDFQFNQSMSLADSRQSLNSSTTQNSLSEAQNEILSTIENHFKMLNDKLQKKEQVENYLGIIIGFTSLTSSFLISIPFSIIRNRSRTISLVNTNDRELIQYFSNFPDFPERRLIMECCCESLLYQSCFTLTEDIISSIKSLMEDPKKKKKEEKNKKLKKTTPVKKENPSFMKTALIKSVGFVISYPMYKSYIYHPINYPKNMFQNYKDVFSSIKRKIVNNFINDSFKSKTQGVLSGNSMINQTHANISSPVLHDHSTLEQMPVIDTTRWYSPFFTTVFYWISSDLIEMLISKGINRLYSNGNDANANKKGKVLQRKPIPGRQSQNQSHSNGQTLSDDNTHSGLPPSIPNSSQSQTAQEQQSSSNKEQRQNNGRSPQHSKVIKVSTTMLKRVYIDVFCRLASSLLTKIITYPLDTICIKLLINGSIIKPNTSTSTSTSFSKSLYPVSDSLPLINKDIHGFWSCCHHIYQTKGILGFYENFLYGMIPEILFNTVILELTYYATNYFLKYVESKYEIIPKSKYRHKKRSKK